MVIPTIILRFLFIAPLLLIGFFTSYSDIKYGKIKNSYLKIGFIYICCLYFFLFIYSQYFLHANNYKYLLGLLLNSSICLIVGYLLWHFNLWAAGDAKLLVIYSLLIPLETYINNYISYFPSLIILIDTITLIVIFLLCKLIIKIIYELVLSFENRGNGGFSNRLKGIKYFVIFWVKPQNFKRIFIKIFSFFIPLVSLLIISQILKSRTEILLTSFLKPFLVYSCLLLLNLFLFRIMAKNKILRIIIIILGLTLCFYLLVSQQVFLLISIVKRGLIMMCLFGIFIQSINWYLEYRDIKLVAVCNLRPGMFLTQSSINVIQNKFGLDIKFDIKQWNFSDGLTENQIRIIQEIFQTDSTKTLTIYSTFPFAPFLFLTTTLLLITKYSIFFRLMNFIKVAYLSS